MKQMSPQQLHEATYSTPEGQLRVAIVLTEDDRVGVYEWDEEHGYLPLVGPYEVPDLYGEGQHEAALRDWDLWRQEHYEGFWHKVRIDPTKHRELPLPASYARFIEQEGA